MVAALLAALAACGEKKRGPDAAPTEKTATTAAASPVADLDTVFVPLKGYEYKELTPEQEAATLPALENPEVRRYVSKVETRMVTADGTEVAAVQAYSVKPELVGEFTQIFVKGLAQKNGVEPKKEAAGGAEIYVLDAAQEKAILLSGKEGIVLLFVSQSMPTLFDIVQEWSAGAQPAGGTPPTS